MTRNICLWLFFWSVAVEAQQTFSLQNLSFLSEDFERSHQHEFQFFNYTLIEQPKNSNGIGATLSGKLSAQNSAMNQLDVQELYYTYQFSVESEWSFIGLNTNLSFGRKKSVWSQVDEDWNLGLFQPLSRWNPLETHTQGLFGLDIKQHFGMGEFHIFTSPIFIPDQGPSYEIKDGQFNRTNPWFRPPPQSVLFQGQVLPIDYVLHEPKISEVVLRPLFALQWSHGQSQSLIDKALSSEIAAQEANLSYSVSVARKPAHQLALAYKPTLVTNRVRAELYPRVYQENLYAADLGAHLGQLDLNFSSLYIDPEPLDVDSTLNQPELKPQLVLSPRAQMLFNWGRLYVSYLKIQGDALKDQGPDTSVSSTSFSERFLFREAYQLGFNIDFFVFQKIQLFSDFDIQFNLHEQFKKINFKNTLNLGSTWSVWQQLILLNISDQAESQIKYFQDLDQLWFGAMYEF